MSSSVLPDALNRISAFVAVVGPRLEERRKNQPLDLQNRIAVEPTVRRQVDKICRQWASKDFPNIENEELGAFVLDRMVEAQNVAIWLIPHGFCLEEVSVEDALASLLVDWWVLVGCYRWRSRVGDIGR